MRTALLALLLTSLTLVASAAPITGELSLNGSDTFTPTSITFINPANIGGQTGSFSLLSNCTGCATMTSFDVTTANFQLYTATEGAITTTLTTIGLPSFVFTPGSPLESLAVTGAGTLTLTGFDPTPGNFDVTTQGPGGIAEVTFSSTAVAAAPEPGTIALFGLGMVALYALLAL